MGHHKASANVDKHASFKVGKGNAAVGHAPEKLGKIQELRAASSDALAELKSGVGRSYGELKHSVQKVIRRFDSVLH